MLRKEEVLQNLTSARTVMSTIQAMTSKVYVQYFVRVRPIGYMTLGRFIDILQDSPTPKGEE